MRSLRRAMIAGVVACLLVLQGLAAMGFFSASSHTAQGASGQTAFADKHCVRPADDDGSQRHRHDQDDCCVLCAANNRHLSLLALVVLAHIVAQAEPEPTRLAAYSVPDDIDPRPSGWGSSWSSRAPPVVS